MLAGVCGGVAAYLGVDSVFVRLAFVVLLFASGIGLPIYLILWLVMPSEGSEVGTSAEVIQKNVNEFGETVSAGIGRVGRPGTVGIVLVLFGAYFLLGQFGWGSGWFWPLVLIGGGIYLLLRR
jgi:phage shock protein PspC (stress-responsive transcriptional regulator)